jgi:hypothetical protein
MNRPTVRPGISAAPRAAAPQATAQSARRSAERAKAARARGAIAASLGLLTVIAVVLSFTMGLTWWATLVTASMMGGVAIAGRRTVLAEQRADSARAAGLSGGSAAVAGEHEDRELRGEPEDRAGQEARTADAEGSAVPDAEGASTRSVSVGAVANKSTAGRSTAKRTAGPQHVQASASPFSGGAAEALPTSGRRPGVSGRIRAGREEIALPAPLTITDVELGTLPVGAAPSAPQTVEPTEVLAPVPVAEAYRAEPKREVWTPTDVPAPSYTLKSDAARWEPKQLTAVDYARASEAAFRATEQAAREARAAGETHPETSATGLPTRVIFTEGALDLDRALAKRRAAGG